VVHLTCPRHVDARIEGGLTPALRSVAEWGEPNKRSLACRNAREEDFQLVSFFGASHKILLRDRFCALVIVILKSQSDESCAPQLASTTRQHPDSCRIPLHFEAGGAAEHRGAEAPCDDFCSPGFDSTSLS
jgi:hypothetical protein